VVLEAVEQAAIQLPRVEGASAEARRADALEVVAQRFLQPDEHGEPTTEIVIHADSTLSVGVIDKAALALSIDAMRRLGCDATLRRVCDNDDRYDIGRKRHAVPPRLRRTVVHRDRDTCRFPGCTNRHYLHVHHIEHWIEGGSTNKSNLVLLCSVHHRLMHEGHWRAIGNANHTLAFRSPSGRIFRETAPPAPRIDPSAISRRHADVTGDRITTSHGERMDLDWTVMALCTQCPPERWLRAA
jgi:hypothetical protein